MTIKTDSTVYGQINSPFLNESGLVLRCRSRQQEHWIGTMVWVGQKDKHKDPLLTFDGTKLAVLLTIFSLGLESDLGINKVLTIFVIELPKFFD